MDTVGSGPYDVSTILLQLKSAIDLIEEQQADVHSKDGPPILAKLDITRDLSGSFFAMDNWKEQHSELLESLESWMGIKFKDNGNSFDSCF